MRGTLASRDSSAARSAAVSPRVRRRWRSTALVCGFLLVLFAILAVPSAIADPPLLSGMPSNQVVEATSASGATVTYTLPQATDGEGNPTTVSCAPNSGTVFPRGVTTVTCSAIDTVTNDATTATFVVTVVDTTPPVLKTSNIITEAAGPFGKFVAYSVSATDLVDPSPKATCSPFSGSIFPLGTTTVNCTAKDASNNSASGSFTITVRDTKGPVFSGVPTGGVYEANGPGGTIVTYALPTAIDAVDGPFAGVVCMRPSGQTFPLGSTTVTCTAEDSRGNASSASFVVWVVDTTPPVLTVPALLVLRSNEPVPASNPAVEVFLSSAVAADMVDPAPSISNDAPSVFPLGTTQVTFTASDWSGNRISKTVPVTVGLKAPAQGARADLTPPGNVRRVSAKPGNRVARLSWLRPPDTDFDHVVVIRTDPSGASTKQIYVGLAARYTDRGLSNGQEYRYVIVSYDHAGNRSVGVAILVVPKALMLVQPVDGSTVGQHPVLKWVAVKHARYYNVQLFRNGRKILSIWPRPNRFALRRSWVFGGHRYRLGHGRYQWFVWPGFGSRSKRNYGPLLGESSFVVR
jgi:HYR domain-containing protein